MGDLSIFRASVLKFSAAQSAPDKTPDHTQSTNDRERRLRRPIFQCCGSKSPVSQIARTPGSKCAATRRSAQRGALAHSIDGVVLEESDLKGSRLCNEGLACKCARPGLVPNSRHARGCRRPEPRVLGTPHTVSPSLGTFVTLRADRPTLRIPYR